jgi:hypothetical protein
MAQKNRNRAANQHLQAAAERYLPGGNCSQDRRQSRNKALMLVPKHHERQLMQLLRGRGWVSAIELPDAVVTLEKLLEKRWIEKRGTGKSLLYRLTDEGMAAKKYRVVR